MRRAFARGQLTGKVGKRSFATDKAGAGHGECRLSDAGPDAGAEGGSGSKERGSHDADKLDGKLGVRHLVKSIGTRRAQLGQPKYIQSADST